MSFNEGEWVLYKLGKLELIGYINCESEGIYGIKVPELTLKRKMIISQSAKTN